MTDNAPNTSTEAVERLADKLMAEPDHHYQGYGQSAAFKLRALAAERDMAKEGWAEAQDLIRKARLQYSEEKASAEAAEAAIIAALELLDASLFTNAEHQQAKDILRCTLKPRQE